ncbi:MAG: aminotransferase class V-fold PLP-dependent enzyme [Terriglobia bacterium]
MREQVAELIGAHPLDVIFTSCATESNNTAIAAALKANPTKRHIVTSLVEHSSVLNYCMALEKSEAPLLNQEGPRVRAGVLQRKRRLVRVGLALPLSMIDAIMRGRQAVPLDFGLLRLRHSRSRRPRREGKRISPASWPRVG